MDRDKVIKGLKCLSALEKDRYVMVFCENCKYGTESYCTPIIANDALAMLKEQDKRINMKQRRIDQLCKQLTDLKHRFHEKTELVRCKDCKHYDHTRLYKCRIHGSMFQLKDENWFCADGEPKEDR